MFIKNILVSNLSVIEEILNYLTTNNINFLFIKESNELHFNNYILRFFIKDNILNIINNISLDKDYKCDEVKTSKSNTIRRDDIKRYNQNINRVLKMNTGYKKS